MKQSHFKTLALALAILIAITNTTYAQNKSKRSAAEEFGNTLNLGLGIGYYGYLTQSVPFLSANYEFDVAKNFTIAPFVGFASYKSGNHFYGSGYYYYRHTFIPIGAKGTYYFDKLLGAGSKWDFYGSLSLGFNYNKVTWEQGYNGNKNLSSNVSSLYWDVHIGTEYHINNKVGLFLDLSTGISTIGLALHHL